MPPVRAHDRRDGSADVEERGGVRSRTSRVLPRHAKARRWFDRESRSEDSRSISHPRRVFACHALHGRGGGEHPYLSRPTDHGLEVLRISYAPPKNHKKRWPTQAQMDVVPHDSVENRNANQSRCDGLIFESHLLDEPIGNDRPLLGPSPEHRISIRDCPARTGADARIEESEANGEVRLALRPHGSSFKRRFPYHRQTTI